MNILKGVKPILFIACFTFGIALFLIYAFTTTITVIDSDSIDKISQLHKPTEINTMNDNPDSSTLSVRQVSNILSATYADKQNNNDLYAASRGEEDRDTDNSKVSQAENKQAAPAAVEPTAPAVKVTAPETSAAAPVKTAVKATAAPVKTAAEPAAAPKAVQSVPAAPAAPAEVKAAVPAAPTSSYENDLDLLARLITAEAQGEPYDAQVAVGAVVMNRVKSSNWPNTIKEVIYQNISGYYQFTPVVNGWIDKPAEAESIKAAKEALSGVDPTNGAQFYYDDKVTNTWILAKSVSVQFGHMIFAF